MTQINRNTSKNAFITTLEATKTKIAEQNHKKRNKPLNAKSKIKEITIQAIETTKKLKQRKLDIKATKVRHPILRI